MDVFFPILDLPSPILVDVLSRLSLKSLCRCRCVCKTFVHLTSDHYFTHVKHNINKQPPMIIMASESYEEFKLSLVIDPGEDYDGDCDDYDDCRCVLRLDCFNGMCGIVHSSNGLVVMMNYDNYLYLCNPLLRDYVQLPKLKNLSLGAYMYGFGYTPVTKQYKLIAMTARSERGKAKFAILTLGTGSTWRHLHITAPYPPFDFEMFNLNGSFQWRYDDSIYVFDIAEEQIKFFPILPTADKELPVLVGSSSLSIIHNHYEDLGIWFLKDYYGNNKESWTKVRVSTNFNYFWYNRSKLQTANEELSSTKSMIGKALKQILKMIDHEDDTPRCVAFDYVPSFVRSKDVFNRVGSRVIGAEGHRKARLY